MPEREYSNSSLDITYVVYIDGAREIVMESDIEDNWIIDGHSKAITTQSGEEYLIFESSEDAGKAAVEKWEDLAQNDPKEVIELIGVEVLLKWALEQTAGPGLGKANSFRGWLDDIVAKHPEEEFASYDASEQEFECKHPDLSSYKVAYRFG